MPDVRMSLEGQCWALVGCWWDIPGTTAGSRIFVEFPRRDNAGPWWDIPGTTAGPRICPRRDNAGPWWDIPGTIAGSWTFVGCPRRDNAGLWWNVGGTSLEQLLGLRYLWDVLGEIMLGPSKMLVEYPSQAWDICGMSLNVLAYLGRWILIGHPYLNYFQIQV